MNLTEHAQRIKKFMQLAGQETPDESTMPSEEIRRLRAKLILEEAFETVEALGFNVYVHADDINLLQDSNYHRVQSGTLRLEAELGPSLVEIADGCGDLSVVSMGTLLACGISDKPVLEAIDESNLRKFGEGGYRRDDGKWVKPPNWIPPNLGAVIHGKPCIANSFERIALPDLASSYFTAAVMASKSQQEGKIVCLIDLPCAMDPVEFREAGCDLGILLVSLPDSKGQARDIVGMLMSQTKAELVVILVTREDDSFEYM